VVMVTFDSAFSRCIEVGGDLSIAVVCLFPHPAPQTHSAKRLSSFGVLTLDYPSVICPPPTFLTRSFP